MTELPLDTLVLKKARRQCHFHKRLSMDSESALEVICQILVACIYIDLSCSVLEVQVCISISNTNARCKIDISVAHGGRNDGVFSHNTLLQSPLCVLLITNT